MFNRLRFPFHFAAIGLFVSCLTTITGCAADIPVMPAEISADTFTTPLQRGTPQLWREALAQAKQDAKPRLHILNQGEDALLARINLIRSARKTIRIQTFMWGNDECGRYVVWELIRAVKQRGITVQILADQMFSDVETDVLAWLATVDPKFHIRIHNPNADRINPGKLATIGAALADFKEVMVRMHDKTFIVDDDIVITGGRNYFNEYFDRNVGLIYKDRDLLILGPGASDIIQSFDAFWNTPRSIPCDELIDVKSAIETNKHVHYATRSDFDFHHLFDEMDRHADDAAHIQRTMIDKLIPVSRIEWVYDDPTKNDSATLSGDSKSSRRLRELVATANTEVLIQSPYFILSDKAVADVKKLREEKPKLRFVVSTNSLAATDAWYVYGVTFKQKRMLLEDLGIVMYELKPIPQDMHLMANYAPLLSRLPTPNEVEKLASPTFNIDRRIKPVTIENEVGQTTIIDNRNNIHTQSPPFLSLHAKSCVIDGKVAFIGSYNVHPRSRNLDTEVGLIIYDEKIARLLQADIERDMAPQNSYLVAPRKTALPITPLGELMSRLSEASPIDVWPARYSSCFELREGADPVPPGDARFHECWKDVGSFPLLKPFNDVNIKTRAAKMLGWFIAPIM